MSRATRNRKGHGVESTRTYLSRVLAATTDRLGTGGSAIATISVATGLGQLVALAAAPVLARLFSPEVFGPFAVANALALSLAAVAALRLDQAVTLPEPDRDATAVAGAGVRVVLAGVALGLVVIAVIGNPLAAALGGGRELARLLFWVPVISGLMGGYLVLSQLAIRHRLYSAIAQRNLLQSLATTGLQLLAGLLGLGAHGLAAGLAVGQFVGVVMVSRSLRSRGEHVLRTPGWRAVFSHYRRFPLVLAPSGAVNALGLHAPVLLASALLGAHAAGLLGMAQRVLLVPVALIGMATSQVFLGEFTAAKRSGSDRLTDIFMRTSRRLLVVGVAIGATLVLAAPWLFETVLGRDWSEAGDYAQLLALAVGVQMVSSPLSQVIFVMGRVWWQAAWDVGRLVVVAGGMVGAHLLWPTSLAAITALGLGSALSYTALWLLAWRAVRVGPEARPS